MKFVIPVLLAVGLLAGAAQAAAPMRADAGEPAHTSDEYAPDANTGSPGPTNPNGPSL